MTAQFCPVCGGPLVTLGACDACRTPSVEFPWPSSLPIDADEVRYDLSAWEPLHRAALTDVLRDDGIAYRFESGLVLVVAATDEERVDDALEELDAPAEEELALAESDNEEQVESDEAAMEALGVLYTTADRLVRQPDSPHAAVQPGIPIPPHRQLPVRRRRGRTASSPFRRRPHRRSRRSWLIKVESFVRLRACVPTVAAALSFVPNR